MPGFLAAHGYDPGPSQRPLLAGTLSGLAATLPALALLHFTGALEVEARILGLSIIATIAAGEVVMAAAGAVYARVFGRAANDVRAGWLSGMAYGFAIWAAGGVMILPLASGGQAPAGSAAIGLFISLVLWGTALGSLVPFVHRPLRKDIETASKHAGAGPGVAVGGDAVERGRDA